MHKNTNLLMLLLLTDAVFLCLHFFLQNGLLVYDSFSLTKDAGFAEIIQYLKEFWIIALLMLMALKKKVLVYFFWSLLFIFILIDDSISLHELIGLEFTQYFDLSSSFGLRGRDSGELIIYAILAITLLPVLASYWFATKEDKLFSIILMVFLGFLGFFGIFLDILSNVLAHGFLSILEDFGEMVVMSFIFWFVYNRAL
ncbi:MAG: hypothetical protein QM479_09375 [Pseudomonadota bacterium]